MERGIVSADQVSIFGDGTPGKPLRAAGGLLSATVELSSAELLNLGTVGIEMVPAPGPGKVLVILGAVYSYKAGSVPYNLSGATSPFFSVQVGDAPTTFNMTGLMTGASSTAGIDTLHDSLASFFSQGNTLQPSIGTEDQPIKVFSIDTSNGNAGFNLLAGDGTVRVTVFYSTAQV